MRIAVLCPYSLSQPGGVQGQVVGLARAFRESGHDAVVIAPSDGELNFESIGLPEEAFVSLGGSLPVPANGSVAPISLSPLGAMKAVRTVRNSGFDVLHLHEPFAPGAGYACLVATSLPKVGTFHRSGAGFAYRVLGAPARALANRLAARCAVSPAAADTARAVLGGDYEALGNGVEVERFEKATPWPTSGPTFLFVGRHEPRKGLSVLLDAWDALGTQRADAVLWVAGVGPETEALRRRHPPDAHLQWLGRIDDDELASRLAGADFLCAPSTGGESFGVVLVEAMAARTAVIASDIPGYSFVVGSHGTLVPPGDPRALRDALAAATGDAETSTGQCAPEALDAALENARRWSMSELSARYLSIYERLVS